MSRKSSTKQRFYKNKGNATGNREKRNMLKGIEYNSSTKGKYPNSKEIVSTGSTENCDSEKWDTEVEKDKKVSFDNVTNPG